MVTNVNEQSLRQIINDHTQSIYVRARAVEQLRQIQEQRATQPQR